MSSFFSSEETSGTTVKDDISSNSLEREDVKSTVRVNNNFHKININNDSNSIVIDINKQESSSSTLDSSEPELPSYNIGSEEQINKIVVKSKKSRAEQTPINTTINTTSPWFKYFTITTSSSQQESSSSNQDSSSSSSSSEQEITISSNVQGTVYSAKQKPSSDEIEIEIALGERVPTFVESQQCCRKSKYYCRKPDCYCRTPKCCRGMDRCCLLLILLFGCMFTLAIALTVTGGICMGVSCAGISPKGAMIMFAVCFMLAFYLGAKTIVAFCLMGDD